MGAGATAGANASDIPNIHQGIQPIVVDYWSDNDRSSPIRHGADDRDWLSYQGRQDPELFTQSDPTIGAAFSSDKQTFKVRHIYSGAILDFRGLYRAQG